MKEYNDYVQTTRGYLKRYNQFRVAVANLEDDIDGMERALSRDIVALPTKDGGRSRDDPPEINTAETARCEKISLRIQEAQESIDSISRILRKIERAIEALDEEKKKLIRGHYIEGKSWRRLALENYLTEKWASEKARRAVKEMSFMIFGKKPAPRQIDSPFVFFN